MVDSVELLLRALSVVPHHAIPHTVDAFILLHGFSHDLLVSTLLHRFTSSPHQVFIEETNGNIEAKDIFWSAVMQAILYAFNSIEDCAQLLHRIIWEVCLPLLQKSDLKASAFQNIVAEMIADLIITKNAWEYAELSLVPHLLRSVEPLVLRAEDSKGKFPLAGMHNQDNVSSKPGEEYKPYVKEPLDFRVACQIVSVLLSKASSNTNRNSSNEGVATSSGEMFCANVVTLFFHPVLTAISQANEDAKREYAIKLLLPSLLRAIQRLTPSTMKGLVNPLQKELLETLRLLFSQDSLQKQDLYFILDISAELLFHPLSEERTGQTSPSLIWNGGEIWEIVKSGLVDEEPLIRKRALHILQQALKETLVSKKQDSINLNGMKNNSSLNSSTRRDRYADVEARSLGVWQREMERWKAFMLLYDMLEEYGTHLVEAAWNHQIMLLLPGLHGKDCEDPISNEPKQHQGKCHFQDFDTSIWWITALWERGFKHDNPQVRRLILQSYMQLEWGKTENLAVTIPESFVLGPLLSTFNDPIHHKDFGLKGIYTSEVAKSAANFFQLYSSSLETRDRVDFVIRMAHELSSRPLCRPGFMTLIMCLEAASSPGEYTAIDDNNFLSPRSTWLAASSRDGASTEALKSSGMRATEVLDRLGPLVEDSKKHFNPLYRVKVCYHLLRAASVLVVLSEVPFCKFFWFLGLFPHEFISYGGMLHGHVWYWIRLGFSSSSIDFESWISNGLYEIANSIIKPSGYGIDIIMTDEEVKAWAQEADKWAKMLALGLLNQKSLSHLMMFVHENVCSIYQRAYNSTCIPEKLLLLLDNIIKVCSLSFEKMKFFNHIESFSLRMEKEVQVVSLTSDGGCTFDVLRKHLQLIISANMDELLTHAERASTVFWNYDFSNSDALPNSVTGKLGGPSQRRLPTKMASDALKGVVAVEVIGNCIVWMCENNSKISDSAHLFIWNLIGRSVNTRTATEEMEGEMQLCLYEALAHVCNALALSVDTHALSVVKQTVNPGVAKDERILDTVVFNLLNNINSLLHAHTLARSRKAFLLQQKWLCLDGLLSIPYCRAYGRNNHINTNMPAVSYTILKTVLVDAINSLEIAGEDNMLPLLRCIRWLVHWNVLQDTELAWSLVRAAWAAVADSNKRRVASVSAFLSAIIHPNIFGNVSMHSINGDHGPLKWLLLKLLDQGSRSPRTMRLTAMHIAGLWLKFPAITQYYIEELYLLSIHGGESIDEELDGQISENVVASREYSMLMQSLDPELIEEFRNSELYVRVTIAVLIHKFAEIVENRSPPKGHEGEQIVLAASNCGKQLVLKLLHALATDADLSKELYKKKSAIHRRKTRAWQMACILSRFVDNDMLEEVMDLLQICLLRNNLPSVRQYAEIFSIELCLHFPNLVKEKIVPALADFNMKTQTLASYVFISVNVLIHATPACIQTSLIDEVVPAVIPYYTTHHHPLRSFSQILIHEVFHKILKIPSIKDVNLTNHPPLSLEKKCLQSIVAFLDENNECRRIRTAVNNFLTAFDPKKAVTPRGIFSLRCGGEEDPSKPLDDIPFECAPIALMDKVSYFLKEARDDLRQSMAADAFTLQCESISDPKRENGLSVSSTESTEGSANFQRKIGSLRFMDSSPEVRVVGPPNKEASSDIVSPVLSAMENEQDLLHANIHSRAKDIVKMRGNRQELIVVATLLGRIPNLAGLARTCEVFKASSLIVADASVVLDRQFQLISVTAEMWVPIKEVPEESLQEYLSAMKKEGYVVVGLEQTANSVSLQKYNFPKRTVLVLGKEKEGIPIEIIQILDECLEIPQLGVIRSLNVHVSGAIAIWEYTRQSLEKIDEGLHL